MIYLSDIRDWLKSVTSAEHYYIGKLDNKQDRSIGVYSLKQSGTPTRAIGGESTYDTISVSLLIHYTDNARETEEFARRLYETLYGIKKVEIKEHKIYIIELLTEEPVNSSKICMNFGGGGHSRAAGCTFEKEALEENKKKLLSIIETELKGI